MLMDLVSKSPGTSRQMLMQFLSDCGVTNFVRIFSHVEFNVKKLMLLTQDSRLADLRNCITEHKKPVYLYDILHKLGEILGDNKTIENLRKLNHVRNIVLHNNEISHTTCTYIFDKDACYDKDYGKIILKENQRIVLSSPDLLIKLSDLVCISYEFLALHLVGRNIIDIDVINRTQW